MNAVVRSRGAFQRPGWCLCHDTTQFSLSRAPNEAQRGFVNAVTQILWARRAVVKNMPQVSVAAFAEDLNPNLKRVVRR